MPTTKDTETGFGDESKEFGEKYDAKPGSKVYQDIQKEKDAIAAATVKYHARNKKLMEITGVGSSAGLAAGIIFCLVKKKGAMAYLGYGLVFTLLGATAANLIGRGLVK